MTRATKPPLQGTVVLLHGLARTHRSMAGMRRHLERQGYRTWAETYPSRREPLATLAEGLAAHIRRDLPDAAEGPLYAVTHSLGGIMLRHLATALPWKGAVMLAPPNTGSALARRLAGHPLYDWFYGPSGRQVAEGDAWPEPPTPFGIIAGTRCPSAGNPVSWVAHGLGLLPPGEPSDGTVTVAETRLPGAADFRTVDASHTWIMDHPDVRRWVVGFLEQGRFPVP